LSVRFERDWSKGKTKRSIVVSNWWIKENGIESAMPCVAERKKGKKEVLQIHGMDGILETVRKGKEKEKR